MASFEVLPFLKWAGGKRWLVYNGASFFPKEFNTYFEPFLGSGAVFFSLKPRKAVLSDKNQDLIDTYLAIQKDWKSVLSELHKHHNLHSKGYYYQIRRQLPNDLYEKAARFIYLNRTCWNGLYRVNLKGEFNVPKGTKEKVLLPDDDFNSVSLLLKNATLFCSDFENIIDQANENDFIYIDPPYTINHSNNGFIKYNDVLFSWEDQIRLKDAAIRAINRGAKVLISNAFHSTIEDLYKGNFNIQVLSRISKISGKNIGRKKGLEMLITGGQI